MNHPVRHRELDESFLHSLMRKQLRLSIMCAAAFAVVLLGLPLVNYAFPEAMSTRVFGFTLSWLILGIMFFPAVWLIAWFFIRNSIRLEDEEARQALSPPPTDRQRSTSRQ